jgi:hypothetical protein
LSRRFEQLWRILDEMQYDDGKLRKFRAVMQAKRQVLANSRGVTRVSPIDPLRSLATARFSAHNFQDICGKSNRHGITESFNVASRTLALLRERALGTTADEVWHTAQQSADLSSELSTEFLAESRIDPYRVLDVKRLDR